MENEIQKLQDLLEYNDKVINALMERLKDIQKVAQESTYFAKDNDIPFSSVVKYSQSVRGEKDQDINPEDVKHKYIPEDTFNVFNHVKLQEMYNEAKIRESKFDKPINTYPGIAEVEELKEFRRNT